MKNHTNQYAVVLRKVSFGTLSFFLLSASAAAQTSVTTTNGGTSGSIPLFTSNSNVENSAINQANGNVGIGTTSPQAQLDLTTAGNSSIRLQSGSGVGTFTVANTSGGYYSAIYNATQHIFEDAGTEVMRISPNGNVGIGTTSPAMLLDVRGKGQFISDPSAPASLTNPAYYFTSGNSTSLPTMEIQQGRFNQDVLTLSSDQTQSANFLKVNENGTTDFTIGSGGQTYIKGNVGIGTTSPGVKFGVVGSGTLGSAWQSAISNGTNAVLIGASASGGDIQSVSSVPLYINYLGNNTILNATAGNVGIGTPTPSARLEVNGSVKIDSGAIVFPDGSSLSSTASLNQLGLTGSGTPAITQANGNVGIGTASPAGTLNLGNVSNSGLKTYSNGTGDGLIVNTYYDSTNNYQGEVDLVAARASNSSDGGSQFRFLTQPLSSGNPAVAMLINQNGNVGIGTTTPQASLDINGAVRISGSGAGLTFPDGSVQSTAYTGTCPSTGGDYAESVDVEGDRKSYEPGDVMVLASGSNFDVAKSSEPYSTLVAGIYSTRPGYVGRRQLADPKLSSREIPMAMVGIVPTKVSAENGPIQRGDLLVTASRVGYAMKGTDRSRMMGATVGKAMGSLDSGLGVIEVLVSLQ